MTEKELKEILKDIYDSAYPYGGYDTEEEITVNYSMIIGIIRDNLRLRNGIKRAERKFQKDRDERLLGQKIKMEYSIEDFYQDIMRLVK